MVTQTRRDLSLPSGWSYVGCKGEPAGGRILANYLANSPDEMTPGICVAICNAAGYSYAGVECESPFTYLNGST